VCRADRAQRAAAPTSGQPTTEQAEVERLRRQNEKLARDLARTQAALDIMGKAHALLELLSESAEPTREQGPSR
jgi:hypothetical protein